MNIVFICKIFHPESGGVPKHVLKVSEIFINQGHSVSVVCSKIDKKLSSSESYHGVNIIRFSYPKVKYIGLIYIWMWMLININVFSRADKIHVHDIMLWVLPILLIKQIYLTVHGWEEVYPIPKKNKLYKKISVRLASKVLAIGKYISNYYNIEPDMYSYGAVELPKKLKTKNKYNIVFIGRLTKSQELYKLFKIIELLPRKYKVEFCGIGPLMKACKKYGKVHGFVRPEDYLNKASFCFAPGYLSIFESFAYKCITVNTYSSEIKRDIFKLSPMSKYIKTSKSPKVIAEYIQSLSEKDKKLITNKAYKWVKTQSWENMADNYLNLWTS